MLQEVLRDIDRLKERLDRARPLTPAEARRLREYLLVEWTHHSTALEGNTLDLRETRVVLLDGLAVGGKTLREHLEVVDHRDAIEWLESAVREGLPLSEGLIRELNRLVLKSTLPEEAGKYRRGGARVAGSRHVPPPAWDVPFLVRETVREYDARRGKEHPVALAAWLHWRLVFIHPFTDGNGRTARLLMNFSLMSGGYPPAVIRKEDRERYLDALEEASVRGNLEPFTRLLAERVKEGLCLRLEIVGGEPPEQSQGPAGQRPERPLP
ncbi:filamentation induced by cAMP protein Fic [Ammonifex degensii KC4]|uniref:Filamentation induced by cAMP protein Fic n=1 Tax=Ammonifex degensii (strain DSM 10501 / KC4) TaxID=429009 RepID=C9RCH5_AMMDK|nr:Fic family protein [Ammonifex degensii]ACX51952.1 filamentation induced by cAMP protein Fic [Ammonifex degensii KC4]